MHGLGKFDAALDSVALISLIESISMELLLLPPGSFGSFCFVRVPAFLGPSPPVVCFCALLSRLVWDSLYGSWLIRRGPSPIFSRFMMWLISIHRLTVWHWYHSLNASSWCCLPAPLGASVFFRVPASLVPASPVVWFCFSVLASLGQHLVLLGSRFLWVPHNPFCAFAFLSWLLWDSFWFVSDLVSLGPSTLLCAFVLYCPGFSMTVFCGSWLILNPSVFYRDAWFVWFRCTTWQSGIDIIHWMHLKRTCSCCLPAPLRASVLLVSRLLWVPPHALCGFASLSWLLWDSI